VLGRALPALFLRRRLRRPCRLPARPRRQLGPQQHRLVEHPGLRRGCASGGGGTGTGAGADRPFHGRLRGAEVPGTGPGAGRRA